MNKAIRTVLISGALLVFPVVMMAQTPPHPNGGNPPGGGNIPVGGGAPIDGGLSVMLILGAAYGSRKIYQLKK